MTEDSLILCTAFDALRHLISDFVNDRQLGEEAAKTTILIISISKKQMKVIHSYKVGDYTCKTLPLALSDR